jgi:hypothetical protein
MQMALSMQLFRLRAAHIGRKFRTGGYRRSLLELR